VDLAVVGKVRAFLPHRNVGGTPAGYPLTPRPWAGRTKRSSYSSANWLIACSNCWATGTRRALLLRGASRAASWPILRLGRDPESEGS
jgi:hypothetical protein